MTRPSPLRRDPRFLAILAALLVAPAAGAGEGRRPQAGRVPCPQDAPEGVRLPDRPGCADRPVEKAPATDGLHEIGDVRLRVGGRVGAEYGAAR